MNGKPRAEPDLLDAEILPNQRELLTERDLIAAAEPDAVAEKVRQEHAHSPRAGLVAPDERSDRMEAVEEEVGIDLRPQRHELRLAGQHVELQTAGLGLPRRFVADEQVVREHRQREQQHAGHEEDRHLIAKMLEGRGKAQRGEQSGPHTGKHDPQARGQDRRGAVRADQSRNPAGLQRCRPAGIPRRQADEGIRQRERPGHRSGRQPGQAAHGRKLDRHEHRGGHPDGEVEAEPIPAGDDGMHLSS